MKTATLSMRVTKPEIYRLEKMAEDVGLDRASFMKQAFRRGCADILFERACMAYRHGEISLSRAAEMTQLSLREMHLRLAQESTVLNYGVEDLLKDIEP